MTGLYEAPMRGPAASMRRLVASSLLAAVVLLVSCSTVRLSYDHADWLLARMAERYVDLTEEQLTLFRARLTDFHAWHRSEELPLYAGMFDEAADRLAAGLGPRDVEWGIAMVRARAQVLGEHAADELTPLVATLTTAQLREIEERFARDNRKFADAQLSGDAARRIARRSAWLCERFEDWFGELTPAQRMRIAGLAPASPEIPALRLEERKRRQAVFLSLLSEPAPAEQLRPRLAAFLSRPDAGRSVRSRQAMQSWERQFGALLLDVEDSLSPAQRNHAVGKLRGYAEQFRQLNGRQIAVGEALVRTTRRP
jgi:hypothetical protein